VENALIADVDCSSMEEKVTVSRNIELQKVNATA
jgi:hypothetical protein